MKNCTIFLVAFLWDFLDLSQFRKSPQKWNVFILYVLLSAPLLICTLCCTLWPCGCCQFQTPWVADFTITMFTWIQKSFLLSAAAIFLRKKSDKDVSHYRIVLKNGNVEVTSYTFKPIWEDFQKEIPFPSRWNPKICWFCFRIIICLCCCLATRTGLGFPKQGIISFLILCHKFDSYLTCRKWIRKSILAVLPMMWHCNAQGWEVIRSR